MDYQNNPPISWDPYGGSMVNKIHINEITYETPYFIKKHYTDDLPMVSKEDYQYMFTKEHIKYLTPTVDDNTPMLLPETDYLINRLRESYHCDVSTSHQLNSWEDNSDDELLKIIEEFMETSNETTVNEQMQHLQNDSQLIITEKPSTELQTDEEQVSPQDLKSNYIILQDKSYDEVDMKKEFSPNNSKIKIQTIIPSIINDKIKILTSSDFQESLLLKRNDMEYCTNEILDYLKYMLNNEKYLMSIGNIEIKEIIKKKNISKIKMILPAEKYVKSLLIPGTYHYYHPHLIASVGKDVLITCK